MFSLFSHISCLISFKPFHSPIANLGFIFDFNSSFYTVINFHIFSLLFRICTFRLRDLIEKWLERLETSNLWLPFWISFIKIYTFNIILSLSFIFEGDGLEKIRLLPQNTNLTRAFISNWWLLHYRFIYCTFIFNFKVAGILVILSIQDFTSIHYVTTLRVKNDPTEYIPMKIDIYFNKAPCECKNVDIA